MRLPKEPWRPDHGIAADPCQVCETVHVRIDRDDRTSPFVAPLHPECKDRYKAVAR